VEFPGTLFRLLSRFNSSNPWIPFHCLVDPFLSSSIGFFVYSHLSSPQLSMLPTRHQFILCQALDCSRSVVGLDVSCEELTEVGHLCMHHAADLLGLQVVVSGIEGAGLGLFTTRPRRRGDCICGYLGEIVTSAQFESQPDEYGVDIGGGRVLSARNSTDGFARYANDARSSGETNCVLVDEAECLRKHAEGDHSEGERVCLVAKTSIQTGSELFVSYGREYWKRRG
jgi:hypothetical protein